MVVIVSGNDEERPRRTLLVTAAHSCLRRRLVRLRSGWCDPRRRPPSPRPRGRPWRRTQTVRRPVTKPFAASAVLQSPSIRPGISCASRVGTPRRQVRGASVDVVRFDRVELHAALARPRRHQRLNARIDKGSAQAETSAVRTQASWPEGESDACAAARECRRPWIGGAPGLSPAGHDSPPAHTNRPCRPRLMRGNSRRGQRESFPRTGTFRPPQTSRSYRPLLRDSGRRST